jgi:hypothetical protein
MLIAPEPVTPAQRRAALIFWSGVLALGILIWFLADLIPQHSS